MLRRIAQTGLPGRDPNVPRQDAVPLRHPAGKTARRTRPGTPCGTPSQIRLSRSPLRRRIILPLPPGVPKGSSAAADLASWARSSFNLASNCFFRFSSMVTSPDVKLIPLCIQDDTEEPLTQPTRVALECELKLESSQSGRSTPECLANERIRFVK